MLKFARMQIKYRIGVMPGPWPDGPDGRELLWKLIDYCEASEIDSLWFSERLSSPIPVLEPMTTMAAVAARTRRLKFGPSVLVAPFRSPVLMARELAMLDYLSNGRALPAVGIGVELEREFRAAGVPFRERGRRTDETIEILRRCWTEDEVTYAGEFWQLDRVQVLPKPVQRPFPLWIGGKSEAAMRRAGRAGDGWMPSFITPAEFGAGVERTLGFAAQAGRTVPADHFGTLVYYCLAPDTAAARSVAMPYVPRGRVDDATLDACTAFGPADLLVERLEQYVAQGGSKFIARPMCPPDQMLEQLARLNGDVIPVLHRR
ncbi:MAG: TIGR03619 family F420-dependent LLM class oxidoreductase [Candidatus Rokubacteria bacterium]|nr:TIGR03619 family F420-dependent LLM class oxidoreductase [Candidatus Rokubacteria bacterium]